MIETQAKTPSLSNRIAELKNYRIYLALVLGISFGLLFYSFWLVDRFPAISKQTLLYSVLATLVGVAGYYLLLKRFIGPILPQITRASRWGLVMGSVLIGAYLAQSYLNIPGSPPRYVAFLLPRQSLKISVPPQSGEFRSAGRDSAVHHIHGRCFIQLHGVSRLDPPRQ